MKIKAKAKAYLIKGSNVIEIVKLSSANRSSADPRLFICIHDFHHGRYAFQVVKYFQLAGYKVCFFNSNKFLANLHSYDRYIFSVPGICKVSSKTLSEGNEQDLLLTVNAEVEVPASFRGKRLIADFNVFESNTKENEASINLPYYVHPNMNASLLKVRQKQVSKQARILFYGSSDLEFSKKLVNGYFKFLGRSDVYDILDASGIKMLRPRTYEAFLHELNDRTNRNKIFFIDGNDFRIPTEEWVETLAKFDFFLATPGMYMPMCHNVVEAMAVGVIPILQYGDLGFYPPLHDGVNCIDFDSADEMLKAINTVAKLTAEEVEALRNGVKQYFNEHIHPPSFGRKLERLKEKNIRLYINAEEYSIRSFSPELLND